MNVTMGQQEFEDAILKIFGKSLNQKKPAIFRD